MVDRESVERWERWEGWRMSAGVAIVGRRIRVEVEERGGRGGRERVGGAWGVAFRFVLHEM